MNYDKHPRNAHWPAHLTCLLLIGAVIPNVDSRKMSAAVRPRQNIHEQRDGHASTQHGHIPLQKREGGTQRKAIGSGHDKNATAVSFTLARKPHVDDASPRLNRPSRYRLLPGTSCNLVRKSPPHGAKDHRRLAAERVVKNEAPVLHIHQSQNPVKVQVDQDENSVDGGDVQPGLVTLPLSPGVIVAVHPLTQPRKEVRVEHDGARNVKRRVQAERLRRRNEGGPPVDEPRNRVHDGVVQPLLVVRQPEVGDGEVDLAGVSGPHEGVLCTKGDLRL